MRYILLLLVASCGPQEIHLYGEVEHKVTFDQVFEYIEELCNYDQECIRETITNFKYGATF